MSVPTVDELRIETLDRLDRYHRHQEFMSRTLLGKGFIVWMPGNLYLKIKTTPDTKRPGTYRVTRVDTISDPIQASHLTKEDAEGVAADVINGAGEHGEALHITDALVRSITAEQNALEFIEKAIAKRDEVAQ